jgi:uncharacterized protein YodC (DUF2158 family)
MTSKSKKYSFRRGDVVALRSGGPEMAVVTGVGVLVECEWFVGKKAERKYFLAAEIGLVPPKQKSSPAKKSLAKKKSPATKKAPPAKKPSPWKKTPLKKKGQPRKKR